MTRLRDIALTAVLALLFTGLLCRAASGGGTGTAPAEWRIFEHVEGRRYKIETDTASLPSGSYQTFFEADDLALRFSQILSSAIQALGVYVSEPADYQLTDITLRSVQVPGRDKRWLFCFFSSPTSTGR